MNDVPQAVAEPTEDPVPGLRERKKLQTREAIASAALELFDRDGFHETTIPAIAAAADVSPRTVSSYFPSKEDLVFPDQEEAFARLADRLEARAADETTAVALRAWIEQEMPRWAERDGAMRRQRRVIASDPGLRAVEQGHRARGESLIAAAIAVDLGGSPEGLEPRMAAAATFAIFGVLGAERETDPAAGGADDQRVTAQQPEVLELLDRALRFVDAGIRSLRDEPPSGG